MAYACQRLLKRCEAETAYQEDNQAEYGQGETVGAAGVHQRLREGRAPSGAAGGASEVLQTLAALRRRVLSAVGGGPVAGRRCCRDGRRLADRDGLPC